MPYFVQKRYVFFTFAFFLVKLCFFFVELRGLSNLNHLVAIAVNSKRCECKQFLLNPIQSSISPQIAAKLQSSKELNGEYEDGKYTQHVVNTCVTAATLIHFKLLLQLIIHFKFRFRFDTKPRTIHFSCECK